MKKITSGALLIFVGIVIALYALGFKSPATPSVSSQVSSNTSSQEAVINPDTGTPVMTMEQAAAHNSSSDCYLVINQKAYDVSSYINKHPGGRRNITSRCGKEVTGIFASIHSNFAWNLLSDYYVADIGTVPAASTASTSQTAGATQVSTVQQLDQLKSKLLETYPNAEVISISPKHDFYVAALIDQHKLYEVHIDASGKVLDTEVENDEYDWNEWDHDRDDD